MGRRLVRAGMAMMWAPANLARLVGWFLALMDSTCRAFVWRRARRLPGDARAPDALPKWWLGERETPPVAIVTGAGSGIGFATAKRLHALGARVAVVCATLAEAEETSARIAEQAEAEAGAGPGRERERAVLHEKKKKKVQPVAFGADLRDGAAIDALAEALDADHRTPTDAVRCVVHCAGVMRCVFSRVKRSGLEETAAVNAVAPARLTAALAARRRRRRKKKGALPPLRVVTVGSFVHRAVSAREMTRWVRWVDDTRVRKPDEEEEDEKTKTKTKTYVPATAYACSKTAATMLAYEYSVSSRESHGVCPVLADPGLVDTAINREWPSALRLFYVFAARRLGVLASPEDAAALTCRACFYEYSVAAGGTHSRPPPERCAYLFGAAGARLAPSRVVADARARGACVRALERWARL